jgi:hypothetical protein
MRQSDTKLGEWREQVIDTLAGMASAMIGMQHQLASMGDGDDHATMVALTDIGERLKVVYRRLDARWEHETPTQRARKARHLRQTMERVHRNLLAWVNEHVEK